MFYLLPWVRLIAGNRYPKAADQSFSFAGKNWQRWSRHNNEWHPNVDGIWTMLMVIFRVVMSGLMLSHGRARTCSGRTGRSTSHMCSARWRRPPCHQVGRRLDNLIVRDRDHIDAEKLPMCLPIAGFLALSEIV